MDLHQLFVKFNSYFTFFIIFPLIIIIGSYLSVKLKFVQFTHLKQALLSLLEKNKEDAGSISRFEAISSILAGNFGTGNISGMAVALTTGGPGALVWMWIMVLFASVIQFASSVLGVKYRTQNSFNEFVGGPMYYLKNGLKAKKLACLFAIFTLFGAFTVGNLAQVNSITLPLEKYGVSPLISSLFLSLSVALVILGGLKRFAYFASIIVPFKAIVYLSASFIILALYADKIPEAFKIMFESAFSFSSLIGGISGSAMLKALKTGFDRGLFATDAGTGIVPILQAGARSKNPIVDGLSTLVAPFMVMIVCTSTGLTLIVTGVFTNPDLQSTNMVTEAFTVGLNSQIGGYIVLVSLILFAYTTLLAWSYCGEKAIEFLLGQKFIKFFRILFISFIPTGSLLHIYLIWTLSDTFIALMLFINIVAVWLLSKEIIEPFNVFKESESKRFVKIKKPKIN
jgi:AGCS family alanine or glycine:cation symporter